MDKDRLNLIPHQPGSYQYYNKDGIIIYVGKAKDLNNRVRSYFNGKVTGKTAKLVSEIADFKYIVANSELEAFIIELNLIKKYQPKYNILLKDDKSYPYIEYISKPYPKLKVSRYLSIKKKDNKILFGPYPNAYAARRIVNLINRLYPLKKCNGNPKKVCLYFHIGECLGYCEKKVDSFKLEAMEKEILSFLRGNDKIIKDKIMEKINVYSSQLNFEMANELKKELQYINIIMDKQKVELHDFVDRDVWGYYFDHGHVSIVNMFIRNNKLIGTHSEILTIMEDAYDEIDTYIMNFYNRHEVVKEILVDEKINKEVLEKLINTKFITPLKGKKKKLMAMATLNAKLNLEKEIELINKDEEKKELANESLRELLNLKTLNRIDLFDNSNLFGSFSVSGMVVFKNGYPAKNEYRKYKISLEKNDDYNTMKEVIYRRYYRALLEKSELPDLIIVDGGINQINACKEVLSNLNLDIKVCGLKKNDKHRTNELIDGDFYSTYNIDKDSYLFHYLTRMQDEVHRFTISYHKEIRSKGSIASVLDNVDGIGKKRKEMLIKKYGSIKKISEANLEELKGILPESIACNLLNYLKNYLNK